MSDYIKSIANKRKREISRTQVAINQRGLIPKVAKPNPNKVGRWLYLKCLLSRKQVQEEYKADVVPCSLRLPVKIQLLFGSDVRLRLSVEM